MATDGNQLFLGGDFTTVNGKHAAGLRDLPGQARLGHPANPTTAPTVTSTSAGVDTVSSPP